MQKQIGIYLYKLIAKLCQLCTKIVERQNKNLYASWVAVIQPSRSYTNQSIRAEDGPSICDYKHNYISVVFVNTDLHFAILVRATYKTIQSLDRNGNWMSIIPELTSRNRVMSLQHNIVIHQHISIIVQGSCQN